MDPRKPGTSRDQVREQRASRPHIDWGVRDTDPPGIEEPEPTPKMKSGLSMALAHFNAWAGGISKRVAVLMGVVGSIFTFLSIAFGYWTSRQKFFTQEQGNLMLDSLARIEAAQRSDQETRKTIQEHDREQDAELKEHDRAIVRLDALKNPGQKRFKAEEIKGRADQ